MNQIEITRVKIKTIEITRVMENKGKSSKRVYTCLNINTNEVSVYTSVANLVRMNELEVSPTTVLAHLKRKGVYEIGLLIIKRTVLHQKPC